MIMKVRKFVIVIALIAVFTTVGLVAADEAGIFTINIFNSPNSQIYTDISNSTIQGQTNYTNSNALENITLTNSTLTLNINGQNITITSQGDNLTINAPNQTETPNPNSNNTPLLSVSFLSSGGDQGSIMSGNATHQYNFNVTVGVPTSMNFPWGKNVTHEALGKALMPLVSEYNLATRTDFQNGTNATVASWIDMPIVGGENRFSLFSQDNLTNDQIQSLTVDLYKAFSLAMSGQI
jgi:hypothetical protein